VNEKPTQKERELIKLIAEGCPNKEMPDILGISLQMVNKRKKAIKRKLGLRNNVEIARWHFEDTLRSPGGWRALGELMARQFKESQR
jgi:DNA-binding CsgD family transcriptional regulator